MTTKRGRGSAGSRERQAEQRRLRIGGRHCPVCLELLPRLGGRPLQRCAFCGGHPVAERRCAECHESAVWEGRAAAACGACGHHGSKVKVFAGQEWLKEG